MKLRGKLRERRDYYTLRCVLVRVLLRRDAIERSSSVKSFHLIHLILISLVCIVCLCVCLRDTGAHWRGSKEKKGTTSGDGVNDDSAVFVWLDTLSVLRQESNGVVPARGMACVSSRLVVITSV